MHKLFYLIPCYLIPATFVHAQTFNPAALQTLQQQLSASPAGQQAQQALMQQALQQAAANPQLLASMANSLTPQQQAQIVQQALAIGQQIFTPAEQAKLTAFTASPEGAGIVAKLPQLVQQLAPAVLQTMANSGAAVAPAAGK